MEFPVAVALAAPVTVVPSGPGWWYEPKFDGHRMVMQVAAETVVLYARSGRVVTPVWMDLALAAHHGLREGTVLDGEAVVWREGLLDFSAVQARAASTVVRARALAAALPASYAAFDLLAHPDLGDVRGRPYTERRRLLLELLEDVGPPIQAVPATDDREVALVWYEVLQEQAIEGIVAKRGLSPYRAVRGSGRRSGTPRRWTRSWSATPALRPGLVTSSWPCPTGGSPGLNGWRRVWPGRSGRPCAEARPAGPRGRRTESRT
ncbi:ATP-dependent DNA ligase [Streptomyces subrutilus]|uniref:ATP-dependent DNA ligase n=1 Tax=Streptomyces subrutilus TaxID=36818 RepID=UPI0033CFDF50